MLFYTFFLSLSVICSPIEWIASKPDAHGADSSLVVPSSQNSALIHIETKQNINPAENIDLFSAGLKEVLENHVQDKPDTVEKKGGNASESNVAQSIVPGKSEQAESDIEWQNINLILKELLGNQLDNPGNGNEGNGVIVVEIDPIPKSSSEKKPGIELF